MKRNWILFCVSVLLGVAGIRGSLGAGAVDLYLPIAMKNAQIATNTPTTQPANTPTTQPTNTPTPQPTNTPTTQLTNTPTAQPTNTPTPQPTNTPMAQPTNTPTAQPTNTPTAQPTNTPTAQPTNTPTPQPTNTPTVQPGSAQITHIEYNPPGNDVDGEYVDIENTGGTSLDMTDWRLYDNNPTTFIFPAFTLAAGASVRVWVKDGTDDATNLYWGRGSSVWTNTGDCGHLATADGTLVDQLCY